MKEIKILINSCLIGVMIGYLYVIIPDILKRYTIINIDKYIKGRDSYIGIIILIIIVWRLRKYYKMK